MSDLGGSGRERNDTLSVARRRLLRQGAIVGLATAMPGVSVLAQSGSSPPAAGSTPGTLAETLASYAVGLKYEDLPQDIVSYLAQDRDHAQLGKGLSNCLWRALAIESFDRHAVNLPLVARSGKGRLTDRPNGSEVRSGLR